MRSDAVGTMQALVGSLADLRPPGQHRAADADASLAESCSVCQDSECARSIRRWANRRQGCCSRPQFHAASANVQDRMIDCWPVQAWPAISDTHQQMIQDMIRIFEAQRLVSLNTLFDLADNLDSVSKGEKLNTALAGRLAARISEIRLPQSALTGSESNSLSFGYWAERHIDVQRKLNLRASIEKAAADAQKLKDLRGQLAPFLRDTLVGLTYIHYAPPGAQVSAHQSAVCAQPRFPWRARAHESTWKSTEVFGTGWPSNAGGRLLGSLSAVPYALAEAEQNFLIPSREQALIWGDLVPQMMLSAVIPRWWKVLPLQTHWVGLNMAYGESLLEESAVNAERRAQLIAALDHYAPPVRLKKSRKCS